MYMCIYIYIISYTTPKKWGHSPGEAGEERDRGDRGARGHVVWGASVDFSGSRREIWEKSKAAEAPRIEFQHESVL